MGLLPVDRRSRCNTEAFEQAESLSVGQPDALFMCWVFALHVYHPIFFKTGMMDWVHHVPVYILNTRAWAWLLPARPVSTQSGTITGCANITS